MNPQNSHWIGLDIGGANIKVADNLGQSENVAFPLWKESPRLSETLHDLILRYRLDDSSIAVTMTGELADCFRSKRDGVSAIIDATVAAAETSPVVFYSTTGLFLSELDAKRHHMAVAAANWHALTTFVALLAEEHVESGNGVVIDIGSTTTDITPIDNWKPASLGLTDTHRMLAGELVYTGVARTPLCSLLSRVSYRGENCPVAAELFATTLDCYLMLDEIPESDCGMHTGDGRPATKFAAIDRLARMICADSDSFDANDAQAISREARGAQERMIGSALDKVTRQMNSQPTFVVTAGEGEFLAESIAARVLENAKRISLSKLLDRNLSRCAPAYAVATLAARSQ